MGNLPNQFYRMYTKDGQHHGFFTNKKIMFEKVVDLDGYEMIHIHSYISFSQAIKFNSTTTFKTKKADIVIETIKPNIMFTNTWRS